MDPSPHHNRSTCILSRIISLTRPGTTWMQVVKLKQGLELIDSRMMRRTQQPYAHPERPNPAAFWEDAAQLVSMADG